MLVAVVLAAPAVAQVGPARSVAPGEPASGALGQAVAPGQPASGATPQLPAPSGQPQAIDFAGDPLLRFVGERDRSPLFFERLARAVEQHPSVQQAIAAQREQRQVRAEVRSGLLPQISVEVTGDRSLARNFSNDPDNIIERSRPRERVDARALGEQLVFDFGATANRIDAASARIRAAEAQVRTVAAEAGVRAVVAYYDVLAYQTLVDLGQSFIARHREILEDVKLRLAQGYGPAGDVARVEAYLATAEGQVARYERQLAAARARYLEAFGEAPPARLSRPEPPASAARDAAAALELAQASAVVAAERAGAEAAREEWHAARAERLPRISGQVDATQYDVLESQRDYDVRARLVLRHSLFAGGRTRARANQALQRFRQAEFSAARVANEAGRDAGIAFADVQVLENQAATLERAYRANRRTRDLFVEQFKVARGSLLDILQAEQDYFQAAASYLQGAAELDVARYALLERTGELLGRIGVSFSFSTTRSLFGGQ